MKQTPGPGEKLIFLCGDQVSFKLEVDRDTDGEAFLRTNIGCAAVHHDEIIANIDNGREVLNRDWHDLPMKKASDGEFVLTLPLLEVGCFEAKAWFLPTGARKPQWNGKGNTKIKVGPADTVCDNTVYTVFVRQFGRNITENKTGEKESEAIRELEQKGYSAIPPSGTFRDVIRKLDFITGTLRSRIVQLLPIHPVPTVYGRMGRYGSPFAALDFFAVDPALAEFDPKATPLEQFHELIDAVHARKSLIFIDIPVNHTGWGARLQAEHPEWFVRNDKREFVSPGAWGVVWADLCQLDYRNSGVFKMMADVFLYWCRQGIDGFRCDAGYMVPFEAWCYITARVRQEFPDTVFMLEGLGGSPQVVDRLLEGGGLDWAYSELFQNYGRDQITRYLSGAIDVSMTKGVLVHFAETHDNNRLAAHSSRYAKMRTALCAMFAHNGAFGITNGVEWFARDKVDVHEARPLNWGAEDNQVEYIRVLQALLEIHPAFHAGAYLMLIQQNKSTDALALRRCAVQTQDDVLVLVNLDTEKTGEVCWKNADFDVTAELLDLISGKKVSVSKRNDECFYKLEPGEVLCLSRDPGARRMLERALLFDDQLPERIVRQKLKATVMRIIVHANENMDIHGWDVDALAEDLRKDPYTVCMRLFDSDMPPVTVWRDGIDQRRDVVIPDGDMLLILSDSHFRVQIEYHGTVLHAEKSIPGGRTGHFAIVPAERLRMRHTAFLNIRLAVFDAKQARHSSGRLLAVPRPVPAEELIPMEQHADVIRRRDSYALATNRLGGMSQVSGAWGELRSKYDAILAGNCHQEYPVDRTVMFTRCRAWVVYCDYSQEVNLSCLSNFIPGLDNRAQWYFSIPIGQGKKIDLQITLSMADDADRVCLHFVRVKPEDRDSVLEDALPVKLILRPDIESRLNHEVTKAYTGPELAFPRAVLAHSNGFEFNPSFINCLRMELENGSFIQQPEWHYMIHLPVEEARGLESHTDLFSPGYFESNLKGGQGAMLTAEIANCNSRPGKCPAACTSEEHLQTSIPLKKAMRQAMKHFMVKRNDSYTVIAGYPWFLDWGRDTLISLRGLIGAGYIDEAANILTQFAGFEERGTIPNMIRGEDDSNRDTSDAPLWMFVALNDFIRETGSSDILNESCRGRKMPEILLSIVHHYISGTPNGIGMDKDSGLIFSPSHFTWMDTNHPAGTPREGYPIEIQALWYAALKFLAEHVSNEWNSLADKVTESLEKLYRLPDGSMSDCLHTARGTKAATAAKDNACRSNQLLAVTLGAVRKRDIQVGILNACQKLVIPGAIRSLADAKVEPPLPVYHHGRLLNNPDYPYWGAYSGDEDTRRKPAYHNGTAWTWPFPSYCEAMFMLGGESNRARAMSLLKSGIGNVLSGTAGHFPEVLDGDSPHHWRGCGAQAWGVTEFYRVYKILENNQENET